MLFRRALEKKLQNRQIFRGFWFSDNHTSQNLSQNPSAKEQIQAPKNKKWDSHSPSSTNILLPLLPAAAPPVAAAGIAVPSLLHFAAAHPTQTKSKRRPRIITAAVLMMIATTTILRLESSRMRPPWDTYPGRCSGCPAEPCCCSSNCRTASYSNW